MLAAAQGIDLLRPLASRASRWRRFHAADPATALPVLEIGIASWLPDIALAAELLGGHHQAQLLDSDLA